MLLRKVETHVTFIRGNRSVKNVVFVTNLSAISFIGHLHVNVARYTGGFYHLPLTYRVSEDDTAITFRTEILFPIRTNVLNTKVTRFIQIFLNETFRQFKNHTVCRSIALLRLSLVVQIEGNGTSSVILIT
jgi:hypothetical protein